MAISFDSAAQALLPKLGFQIHDQVKAGWNGMDSGKIKEMVRRKTDNVINIDSGHAAAKWTPDFGTVKRTGRTPSQATYSTKALVGGVEIGLQAHDETDSAEEGVQLLKQALRKTINGFTDMWATAFYNYALYTLTGSVSLGASSFTTDDKRDATRFQVGQEYEVVRSGTVIDTFEVADRNVQTGVITLVSATTVAWASSDIIQSLGAEAEGPKGLVDVAGSGTLYNVSGTTKNWRGNATAAAGANFSKEALENLIDDCFTHAGGMSEFCLIGTKRTARRIYREDKDLTGFSAANHDPRGKGDLKVDGMDYLLDQPAGEQEVWVFNGDDVKWHTSLKLAPPGSSNKAFSKQNLRLDNDRAAYIYDMRMSGNIHPTKRSTTGRYSGWE